MAEKLKKLVIEFNHYPTYTIELEEKGLHFLNFTRGYEFASYDEGLGISVLGLEISVLKDISNLLHGSLIEGLGLFQEDIDISSIVIEFTSYKIVLGLEDNRIDFEVVKKENKSIYFSGFNIHSSCLFSTNIPISEEYAKLLNGIQFRPYPRELKGHLDYMLSVVGNDKFFKNFTKLVKSLGFNDVYEVYFCPSALERVYWDSIRCKIGHEGKAELGICNMGGGLNDLLSLYTYYKYCEMFGGILITPQLGNFHPILYNAIKEILGKQDKVQVITYERQ